MAIRLMVVGLVCAGAAVVCRRAPAVQPDLIVAVSDGPPVPPTPQDVAARLAALAPCPPTNAPPPSWRRVAVRVLTGTSLRAPADALDRPDEVPDSTVQAWEFPGAGRALFQLDPRASLSSGFMITPADSATRHVSEGECVANVAGRRIAVRQAILVRASEAAQPETTFVLTTDVPFAPDSQLGVGLLSGSRRGRESLLSALLSLELPAR
jgi:hypothetical protein